MKTHLKFFRLALCLFLSAAITACQQAQEDGSRITSETNTNLPAVGEPTEKKTQDWVKLDSYQFRLVPDFHANEDSRLEFFIRDAEDNSVPGATGALHVTKSNGPEIVVPLLEAYHYYYASTTLAGKGQYEVTAQIMLFGKKYSPHFSFTR